MNKRWQSDDTNRRGSQLMLLSTKTGSVHKGEGAQNLSPNRWECKPSKLERDHRDHFSGRMKIGKDVDLAAAVNLGETREIARSRCHVCGRDVHIEFLHDVGASTWGEAARQELQGRFDDGGKIRRHWQGRPGLASGLRHCGKNSQQCSTAGRRTQSRCRGRVHRR